MSLLPLYGHHRCIVFEQTVTFVICDNNTTFHNTITGSTDGEKNSLYGRIIKSILNNFLNKLRSKFGQEDDLTENQGQIHEHIGIKIYCLIAKTTFH